MLTSVPEVSLWIVVAVFLALVGLRFGHKVLPVHELQDNVNLISSTTGIIGTLLSIVLGFVISSAADEYKSLEACVDSEASSIGEIFRLSRALPEANALAIQRLCVDYCESVSKEEWPLMREGKLSDGLTKTYLRLSDEVIGLSAETNNSSNIQSELLSSLREVGDARRARSVAITSKWIRQLMPMLWLCSIVTMLTTYLYVERKPTRMQNVLVAFAAIVLGANFGVLNMLSRPFNVHGGLTPEQFEVNCADMKKFLNLGTIMHKD